MRTTPCPDPADWLGRLWRLLAHRPGHVPTTPPRARRPAVHRIWREVAPGEWRWLHVPDRAAPK
jgi:hypothetical protein